MTLTIIIILLFAVLIALLNRKDRFVLLFGIQAFCAAIMLFACFMIVAKLATYKSNFQMDLMLYLKMQRFDISIHNLINIYNISNALFIICCCFQYRLFRRITNLKTMLLLILPLLTVILNNPELRYRIFISFFNTEAFWSFKTIYTIIYIITAFITTACCLLAAAALMAEYKKAKIRINKKRLQMLFVGFGVVILFVLCVFTFGPLSFMHFLSNIYFPDNIPRWSSYIYLPVILLIAFTAYTVTIAKYNYIYSPLKKTRHTEINDTDSVRMLFHNYKNSFFIIERLAGQISKAPHLAEKNAGMIKEIAEDSSTAIAKIIESFKNDFAFNPNKFNITECTKKAVNKSNISESVTVVQSYISENDFIYGNEAALCDAIVNIINNAADSVSTNENEKLIKISVFSEQELCCIEIEDNGKGIPRKTAKKIFSPFYSTKHGGKNNGIGLTYTKKIVSEHQGKIDLKSVPNQLTSFQLVFPVYKAKKSSRQKIANFFCFIL